MVVWQFRRAPVAATTRNTNNSALRLIAITFFTLAAYVLIEAGRDLFFVDDEAGESIVGIVLAALSLAVMPTLAWAKRRTALALGSPTLRADAQETFLCAWLSAALLAGLALDARVRVVVGRPRRCRRHRQRSPSTKASKRGEETTMAMTTTTRP